MNYQIPETCYDMLVELQDQIRKTLDINLQVESCEGEADFILIKTLGEKCLLLHRYEEQINQGIIDFYKTQFLKVVNQALLDGIIYFYPGITRTYETDGQIKTFELVLYERGYFGLKTSAITFVRHRSEILTNKLSLPIPINEIIRAINDLTK